MSVEFNEESSRYLPKTKYPSGISGLIIKSGLAKDARGANIVMIGVIVVMLVIFLIVISGNDDADIEAIDPTFYMESGMP